MLTDNSLEEWLTSRTVSLTCDALETQRTTALVPFTGPGTPGVGAVQGRTFGPLFGDLLAGSGGLPLGFGGCAATSCFHGEKPEVKAGRLGRREGRD